MDKPHDADGVNEAPDLAHYLHHDHSGDTHPRAASRPPAAAGAPADDLRDVEKSLVERIADVDDDRRRTTQQMQKAWQTQRRDIEGRLARQRRVLVGLLGVQFVIVVVGLAWLHQGLEDLRGAVAGQQAAAAPATADPAAFAALEARLAAALTALSERQDRQEGRTDALAERLDRAATDAAAVGVDEAELAPWLQPLRAEQSRLAQAIEALGSGEDGMTQQAVGERLADLAERQGRLETELERQQSRSEAAAEGLDDSVEARINVIERRLRALADGPASAQPPPPTADPGPGAQLARGAEPALQPAPGAKVLVGARPFALQLLGAYNRDAVLALARRDLAGVPVLLREETYRGRPWFVLIHSLHASRAAAMDALDELPDGLAGEDVWIRPLTPETELISVVPEAAMPAAD